MSGLDVVAEKALDIKNLDVVKRMIIEEVNRNYKSSSANDIFKTTYIIKLEGLYYRQFYKNVTDDSNSYGYSYSSWQNEDENGSLLGLYLISEDTEFNNEIKKFTAVTRFSNLILDDSGKVNLSEMNEMSMEYDDTYSLATVKNLLEGYGYNSVK